MRPFGLRIKNVEIGGEGKSRGFPSLSQPCAICMVEDTPRSGSVTNL